MRSLRLFSRVPPTVVARTAAPVNEDEQQDEPGVLQRIARHVAQAHRESISAATPLPCGPAGTRSAPATDAGRAGQREPYGDVVEVRRAPYDACDEDRLDGDADDGTPQAPGAGR